MAVHIKKGMVAYQLPVTPMVDLVFNLLLFFIMATTFATEEHQLKLMLPAASEALPLTTRPREMVINVDQEGHYFLTGSAIPLSALEEALNAASTNNPGRASAIIRADERCHWKYVVAAMNACTKAKIFDVHVMTRQGAQ
jgi:biopolymer transport protein ExbD